MSNTVYIDTVQVTIDYLDKLQQESEEETEAMIEGLEDVMDYLILEDEEKSE